MAAHDLHHLGAVRRTARRRVDHLGSLAEILGTERGRRDQANLTSWLPWLSTGERRAECLSRPDAVGVPSIRLTRRRCRRSFLRNGRLCAEPSAPFGRDHEPCRDAAGFEELRMPHMAVLQFPGPDGVRPGLLAERAGMSKQAMNQLLRSLEALGYLVRSDAPDPWPRAHRPFHQARTRRIHKDPRHPPRHRTRMERGAGT